MADAALHIFEFTQGTSGKSIPSILNRKRKSKTFMENQENVSFNSSGNGPTSHKIAEASPMRSRSPLQTLEFNFHPISQNRPVISPPKVGLGLHLRESWKRFRDSNDKEDSQEPKHKVAKKTPNDLWAPFVSKNRTTYQRDQSSVLLSKHPSLTSRMRIILLDWLIEVCEVYRLHRETFYLATDFLDRYMSKTYNLQKTKLQLIGVTCLFIASKIEEIYPPKLQEFAYVTDGACTEEDILAMELVVLKQLNWSLSPKTPNAWTKLLLQIDERRKRQEVTENVNSLIKPSYCGLTHSKTMHLVDLCILDISSLNFSYASLAASALYFVQDSPLPSELDQDELSKCISWMTPFAQAVTATGYPHLRSPAVTSEDQSNYQCHSVDIKLLDLAHHQAEMINESAKLNSSNDSMIF